MWLYLIWNVDKTSKMICPEQFTPPAISFAEWLLLSLCLMRKKRAETLTTQATAWSQILLCNGEMTMLAVSGLWTPVSRTNNWNILKPFFWTCYEMFTKKKMAQCFSLHYLWTKQFKESLYHVPLSSVSENMPQISTNWLIMHWGDRLITKSQWNSTHHHRT